MKAAGLLPILPGLVFTLVAVAVCGNELGVKLSLDFKAVHPDNDDPHNKLNCTNVGGNVTITRMSVTRIRQSTGVPTNLLTVTPDIPVTQIDFGNTRGKATLEENKGGIELKLYSATPGLPVDYYVCEAIFTNSSGMVETTFTMIGPDVGNLPAQQAEGKKDAGVKEEERDVTNLHSTSGRSIVEAKYLSQKMARLEQKVDFLDERVHNKIDNLDRKHGSLEREIFTKVESVETSLSLRLSRVEDRLSSLATGSGSGDDLEKEIADIKESLAAINESLSTKVLRKTVCERGMGDDVTKDYPKYVTIFNEDIKKYILCDTQTDGGGWIIFQRRAHGDLDFFQDWSSYRDGFGAPVGDFWLGNDAIHQLTDAEAHELRVDMRIDGRELFAAYSHFRLDSETNKYSLRLGGYTGNANDALSYHNDQPFSTFDRKNNDGWAENCAVENHGAWWYDGCYKSNLNGIWNQQSIKGAIWDLDNADNRPVSFSEMKIRRVKNFKQ